MKSTRISFLLFGSLCAASSPVHATPSKGAATPRTLAMRRPVRTAQAPTPPPPADAAGPAEPPPPAEAGDDGELTDEELLALSLALAEAEAEVIEVTGSLIARREVTSPAPVTVLDRTDLNAAGMASIGDILQDLPSQSNAINVQFNNGGDGSTRVDLRGLGAARTLVLLNGRRVVPGGTGADASVDLSSIPLAMIERVEVLKDGASAIYGSDAIGGVVNIITRTELDGSEVNLYTGTTQHGSGGTVYDLSFVTGATSARSSIMFSAGYYTSSALMAGEREFSRVDREFDYETRTATSSGSTATPDGLLVTDEDGDGVPDAGNDAWDDVIASCPSGVCTGDGRGGWRDFGFGGADDSGDLYNYQPDNYLVTPQQRYNVFATGHQRLGDHARAFFEGSYANRTSDQRLAPEPLFLDQTGLVVSADSIYNPYGKDIGFYRRRLVELGTRDALQNVHTFRAVVGLDGQVPQGVPVVGNWKWELSFNYGRTEASERTEGNLIRSRLAAALGPSFVDGGGVARCGSVDAPGDPDCVPLDLLGGASANGGAGSITPEMAAYPDLHGDLGRVQRAAHAARPGARPARADPVGRRPVDGDRRRPAWRGRRLRSGPADRDRRHHRQRQGADRRRVLGDRRVRRAVVRAGRRQAVRQVGGAQRRGARVPLQHVRQRRDVEGRRPVPHRGRARGPRHVLDRVPRPVDHRAVLGPGGQLHARPGSV